MLFLPRSPGCHQPKLRSGRVGLLQQRDEMPEPLRWAAHLDVQLPHRWEELTPLRFLCVVCLLTCSIRWAVESRLDPGTTSMVGWAGEWFVSCSLPGQRAQHGSESFLTKIQEKSLFFGLGGAVIADVPAAPLLQGKEHFPLPPRGCQAGGVQSENFRVLE